ncbi:MAG: hypothetical protein ACRDAX_07355 [Propionibacteriaceae bacterium]
MILRRRILALAGSFLLAGITGCTSASNPAPANSSTITDWTAPGATLPALTALCDAAGSKTLVKAEVSATRIAVAVLIPKTSQKNSTNEHVETWEWRDGVAQKVDGDTQNVGQTRFSLNDFNLSNVRELFTLAGVVAGSAKQQELQIVTYSPGRVLMTVTTQPESVPVFFRPDGTLIRPLDLSWPNDFSEGFGDATKGMARVTAVGIQPSLGIWSELTIHDVTLRQIRAAKAPAREETRQESSSLQGWEFDPAIINLSVLTEKLKELGKGKPITMVVDRRDHLDAPLIRLTIEGRTTIMDLAGNDVTNQIHSR